MKNSIVILGLTALAATATPSADAGHREWSTVGKVLTGVAVAHAISHAVAAPHVVCAPAPPPVVYVPVHRPVIFVPPVPVCVVPPAPVIVYPPAYCPPPRRASKRYRMPLPAVHVSFGFGHHHHRGGHHH